MSESGQKLYQRIADAIARMIRDGTWTAGTRLPSERELAEVYGVSRPTIREAMIALEIRGMVETRHGAGIFVTGRSADSGELAELDVGAFELMEARLLFEADAAALAATAIEPDMLDQLEAALERIATEESGSAASFQADRRFHMLIAQATGNSIIRSVVEMLWKLRESSPLCIHIFARAMREGVTPRVDEHRHILEALRARNPQAARESMRSHLRRVIDDLLAATEMDLLERARSEAEEQRNRVFQRVLG